MGVVYRARSLKTGRRVALKLLVFPPLLPEGEREALIVRFAREARALASVRHPNVVEVYDVGEVDGQPYMAMEYLEGINARERLSRYGPLSDEETVALGVQLCGALEAVHAAQIVHRDIKPDNLILERDGSMRLTDFGIARLEVEASLTRTGGLLGSPAYMAPEQILGGTVDHRSDLFSAGVTLYQMRTGELPFQGASIMEVAHRVAYEPMRAMTGLAPGLAAVLERTLQKDPDRRYASAADLRDALENWQRSAELPIDASADDPAVPLQPVTSLAAGVATVGWSSTATPRSVCAHHPTSRAAGVCAECGMPLCSRCARHRMGLVWCRDHAYPRARPAWVTRLEALAIGLLFVLLLYSLYPLRW
jgi:serine/threonine protein kinase